MRNYSLLPIFAFHKPLGLEVTHGPPATEGKIGRKLVLNDYTAMSKALCPGSPMPTAVGRLDKRTSGLLLFTADGPLHERLLLPGLVPKVYEATVRLRHPAVLTEDHLGRLLHGCKLNDGMARAESVEVLETYTMDPPSHGELRFGLGPGTRKRLQGTGGEDAAAAADAAAARKTAAVAAAGAIPPTHVYTLRVAMRMGRNRVVRRLLAAAGLPVFALHRVEFGPVHLGRDFGEDFAPGGLAMLSEAQREELRRACE